MRKFTLAPLESVFSASYVLVSAIFAQVYKVEQLKLGLNYGSNKVRFPTVVPVNSRVRGHVELISLATIPPRVSSPTWRPDMR